jgi:universal stress protein E
MSRLLIVADLEGNSQVAMERGLALASRMGVEVDVVGFCHENLEAAGIEGRARLQQARRKLLANRKREVAADVKRLKPPRVKVNTLVVWEKYIHKWINARCARSHYRAVVKTGHCSASYRYTSTDWHLLRSCPAPVMIVSDRKWRKTRPVVATVDMASRSRVERALNDLIISTASDYAELLECELYILHAVHISRVLKELDLVDEYSRGQEIKAALQPEVNRLCKRHQLEPAQFKMKLGPVDKVITSESARLKAQLVVMGTVGRRGVKAALIGNTAEQVLERLRTDVLALKP